MIKKGILYLIYTLLGAAASYYLIVKYGHNTENILQRIGTYTRYIVYTAASIIIGGIIRSEKTIRSKATIGLLSVIHIISLSKIIIYDNFGVQIYAFFLTTGSIVLLYTIMRIRRPRLRNILLLPILGTTILCIMLTTSPFYQDIGGWDDFYNTQSIKLYTYINEPMLIIQEAQANIGITNSAISGSTVQNMSITQSMQDIKDISNNTQIEFSSTIPLTNSALFIQSPQGDIYQIPSQSLTNIHIGTGGLIIDTTGMVYSGTISESLTQYKEKLAKQFVTKKQNFVNNISKNKLWNNTYIQSIGGKSLKYLAYTIPYIDIYYTNFQKRQILRSDVGLENNIDTGGNIIVSLQEIPVIRNWRQNFTNPQ